VKISDHSLRQLDDAYLARLGEEELRALSVKLLADLKESRERLNQDSGNSSRPPSSRAPWESRSAEPRKPEVAEPGEEGEPKEERPGAEAARRPLERRRGGKPVGAPGHGRAAPERLDAVEVHAAPVCGGCGRSLAERVGVAYTGHHEVDLKREDGTWSVRWTRHLWHDTRCECGHVTRAEPALGVEDGVRVGGFRQVGPGLLALLVALALRYRLSRGRIREFLGEWLGVELSVGAIHGAIEEAGAVVAPAEAELIEAVQASGLLHADETPWPERDLPLWLWVFTASRVTLYYISHRGRELLDNLLDGFTGVLMSDGWQAYRRWPRRLRCWAHLKRKAVGLAESLDPTAQAFGREVLALWTALRDAVGAARDGPPRSLASHWAPRLAAFRARCETERGASHAKARDLAGEFLNDWDAIFAVLGDPRQPLTNNAAERALRHWVILRKLAQGTRTERGSRQLALLASVIDTCRQRGHSPWAYLQTAIVCRRQGLALPPLPT
jgi:transposase